MYRDCNTLPVKKRDPLYCADKVKRNLPHVSVQWHRGKCQEFLGCAQLSSFWPNVCWTTLQGTRCISFKTPVFIGDNGCEPHVKYGASFTFQFSRSLISSCCSEDLRLSRWSDCGQPGRSLFGNDLETMDEFPSSQRRVLFSASRHTFQMAPSSIRTRRRRTPCHL